MANIDEINKIVEKEENEENEEENEEIIPKNKLIETITEQEHIVLARHFILDMSSYTMPGEDKRKRFSKDLKENKSMNEYINNQALFKIFKSNNEHIRAGVVYSYLYLKNYNTL